MTFSGDIALFRKFDIATTGLQYSYSAGVFFDRQSSHDLCLKKLDLSLNVHWNLSVFKNLYSTHEIHVQEIRKVTCRSVLLLLKSFG